MDGMTGDPPFLFWISKGDLTRIAYAKFHGIIIAGYILNEFKWIFNILLLVALAVFLNLVFKIDLTTMIQCKLYIGEGPFFEREQ